MVYAKYIVCTSLSTIQHTTYLCLNYVALTGGRSSGCLDNAGAAGTLYEEVPKSITVSNNNLSTQTDTVFLEPPYDPLWTNVFIKNHAKVSLPLRWSRIQV